MAQQKTEIRGDAKLECQLRDSHKAVGQCDGYFEPENRQPHGPMRPGKTAQDQMPVDKRPRVEAWKKRIKK